MQQASDIEEYISLMLALSIFIVLLFGAFGGSWLPLVLLFFLIFWGIILATFAFLKRRRIGFG